MTIAIALYAAIVATFSLSWTVASWLLSTGRAKVEFYKGVVHNGTKYALLPIPKSGDMHVEPDMVSASSVAAEPALFVLVRNVGRLPLTVEQVAFATKSGQRYGTFGGPDYGKPFNCTIQPGSSENFGFRQQGFKEFAAATRGASAAGPVKIFAVVDLGTGKRITSKTRIRA
ncbi:hypothetical protein ACIQH6_02200 [Micromonospora orduensis]|uniref:hypothetical protein n=1 Tax=Micromonospora orduensis TaxID=1420891 RepID=UPI00381F491B